MSGTDDKNKDGSGSGERAHSVVPFPQSKTKPKTSQHPPRELGLSKLAQQLQCATTSLKGHWCSQCKGIWYGCGGECECPICGNRNG